MSTKRKATGIPKNTFRSAYDLGNEDYSETFTDGITEQHHTDQCDINKILAQLNSTNAMKASMEQTLLKQKFPEASAHAEFWSNPVNRAKLTVDQWLSSARQFIPFTTGR